MNGLSAATRSHQRVVARDPAVNPYAIQRHSLVRRTAGLIAGLLLRPLIAHILEYEKMREWVLHHLSNRVAMEESAFSAVIPLDLSQVSAFEDCYWLFSSNKLNHGIMRRRLDEAAYLYRMLKQLDAPRVAELGRFKGGSTFLFAAAGAQVLSLDNNLLGSQPRYVADLQAALQRFHLQDRVVCEIVDALEYPVEPESYDLVFIDFASTRDLAERSFARWWPAVKPGRYLLMCDGKCSPHLDVVDCVSLLDIAQFGGTRLPNTPGAFVVFQKNST